MRNSFMFIALTAMLLLVSCTQEQEKPTVKETKRAELPKRRKMMNRRKLSLVLLCTALFCTQGCSAIRDAQLKRERDLNDRIYYEIFAPSKSSEYCARDIAFTGKSTDDMCQLFKFRPGMQERISRLKGQVSELTKEEIQQSTNGSVRIGMSTSAVRLSLGNPEKINDTTTVHGTSSQWVYTDLMYVYFEEGKVTAWQNY